MTTSNQNVDMDVFQNSTFDNLNEMRKQDLFCDVTLDINGVLFPCHRPVLVAASNYFRAMFSGNFKESFDSGTIPIKEIDSDTVELLLEAMYTSRLNLLPTNVYAIMKASHFLQMDAIFNRCVEYITNNSSHFHYLTETCLFAETLKIRNLYDKCIVTIANNVLRYGKTDAFQRLSFDTVKQILSKVNLKFHDDEVLDLIIKWCKSNRATSQNIQKLLRAPTLSSPVIGVSALAEGIATAGSSSADEVDEKVSKNEADSSSLLKLNVYLKTVDTKTGAAGWGTVKLNDLFDKYTLSHNELTDADFIRICSSGTKMYCLERDISSEKCTFSCYEDNDKIELPVLEHLDWKKNDFECEMIATKDFMFTFDLSKICIYSLEQCSAVRKIDIPLNMVFHPNSCSLSTSDGILYVVGAEDNRRPSLSHSRYNIMSYDHRSPKSVKLIRFPTFYKPEKVSVCTFDRSLAMCCSSHNKTLDNAFNIFDLTAQKWRTDVKPMNDRRANYKLVHSDGFIYAIDNQASLEKYDLNLNAWIEISGLPERIQFVDPNDVQLSIATGSVIYADTIPSI